MPSLRHDRSRAGAGARGGAASSDRPCRRARNGRCRSARACRTPAPLGRARSSSRTCDDPRIRTGRKRNRRRPPNGSTGSTAGVRSLADALAAAGPDVRAWSWTDRSHRGFWARRQANETAMHRWDAQLAAGATEPIDATARRRRHRRVLRSHPVLARRGRRPRGAGETHPSPLHRRRRRMVGIRSAPTGLVVTPRTRQGGRRRARDRVGSAAVPARDASASTRSTCSATRRCSHAGSELVSW